MSGAVIVAAAARDTEKGVAKIASRSVNRSERSAKRNGNRSERSGSRSGARRLEKGPVHVELTRPVTHHSPHKAGTPLRIPRPGWIPYNAGGLPPRLSTALAMTEAALMWRLRGGAACRCSGSSPW